MNNHLSNNGFRHLKFATALSSMLVFAAGMYVYMPKTN